MPSPSSPSTLLRGLHGLGLALVLGAANAAFAHPPPGPYQEIVYELTGVMETFDSPGGLGDGLWTIEDIGTITLRFHDPGLDNIFADGAEVQLAAFDFHLDVVIGGVITDVQQTMLQGGDAHGYFKVSNFSIVWETPVTKFRSVGDVFCPLGPLCSAGALEEGSNPQDDTIDAVFGRTQFLLGTSPPGVTIEYRLAPDPSGTGKIITYTGTEISRTPVGFDDPVVRLNADPAAAGVSEPSTLSWLMAGEMDSCSPLGAWPIATPDALDSGELGVTANAAEVYGLACSFMGTPVTHASLVMGSSTTCEVADLDVGELLNDECYEATQLVATDRCGVRLTQTTTGASVSMTEPISDCAGETDPSQSVWYSFTSPTTQFVSVSTAGSDFPTLVSVWWQSEVEDEAGGQCGALSTQVDIIQLNTGEIIEDANCSADVLPFTGPSQTQLGFKAVEGKTYLIQVADVSGGAGGDVELTLRSAPAVALMGDFAQGDPSTYELEWTIFGERDECTAGADWSGAIEAGGGQQVPYVDGGSLFTLTCSDPTSGTSAASLFQVDPDACPGVVFEDKGAASLVNDECTGATVLQGPTRTGGSEGLDPCPVVIEQDTTGATVAGSELGPLQVSTCLTGDPQATVWFEYTPPADGVYTFSTRGSDYPTFISVWRKEQGCGEFVEEVRRGDGFACLVEENFVGSSTNSLPLSSEGGLAFVIQVGDVGTGNGGNLRFSIIPRVIATFDAQLSGDMQSVEFEWSTRGGYQECVGVGVPSWQGAKAKEDTETIDASVPGFYGFECIAEEYAIVNRSAVIAPMGGSCAPSSIEGSYAEVFNESCESGAHMIVPGECPIRFQADTTIAATELRETKDDPGSPANGSQISPCAPPIGPYPTHSVWYRWRALTNEAVILSTEGSDYPTTITVFGSRGGCNNVPDHIACSQEDDILAVSTNELMFTPSPGSLYFIQVTDSNAQGTGSGGSLHFLFSVPEPGSGLLQAAALGVLGVLARRRRGRG